jgi:hypothetical protein
VTPEEEQKYETWWRSIGKMMGFDTTRIDGECITDYRERMRRISRDLADEPRDRAGFGEKGKSFDS